MIRYLIVAFLLVLVNSCAIFDNKCQEHYVRCQEIKRQIMFINATNNSMVAAQRNAELDNLYRAFRDNGCT